MAPRACVRVYARVLVPPNLYIHTYIPLPLRSYDPYHPYTPAPGRLLSVATVPRTPSGAVCRSRGI